MAWALQPIMQPRGANLLNRPPPAPGQGEMSRFRKEIAALNPVAGFNDVLGRADSFISGGPRKGTKLPQPRKFNGAMPMYA